MNVVSLKREFYINDFIKENIRSQNFPAYPACNLMYYVLLTTLKRDKNIILETGTFHGISTVVIAQAVEDICTSSEIYTIEINKNSLELAKKNFEVYNISLGLQIKQTYSKVEFIQGNSLIEIQKLLEKINRLDFAFLDSNHSFEHVYSEFNLIKELIIMSNGIIYFDNTESGGVNEALIKIRSENDCNLIRFPNCSYSPPGQAIIQF